MEKSPKSSLISMLKRNVSETLIKIQKENTKSLARNKDRKLTIPTNSSQSIQTFQRSIKKTMSDVFTPEKTERSFNSALSPRSMVIEKESPKASPKNFFRHLQTTNGDFKKSSLEPSKTIQKKFPAPVSPCSELESDVSSFSEKSILDSNDIFVGSSQLTLNPLPKTEFSNSKLYSNLMCLYETETKNHQYFENLYKKERKKTGNLKISLEALQNEIEVEKNLSELKINRLLNEVNLLKMANLNLQKKIKQKQRDAEHETHTMLKKSATKILESELETMEKIELLKQFNHLKLECKELSKKLLKQADEMFEKSIE